MTFYNDFVLTFDTFSGLKLTLEGGKGGVLTVQEYTDRYEGNRKQSRFQWLHTDFHLCFIEFLPFSICRLVFGDRALHNCPYLLGTFFITGCTSKK